MHEEQSPRGFEYGNQRSNAEIHALMLPYLYFRILIDQENIQQVIMGTKNTIRSPKLRETLMCSCEV